MTLRAVLAVTVSAAALWAFPGATEAGEPRDSTTVVREGAFKPTKTRYKRKRAVRVYGYAPRRGGYSYEFSDVINTYGQSRVLYGSTNSYRDPFLDRQTPSGPFDHDFFFDSGIAPRGGDSPYIR
jgi:hypothetical protein